MEDLGAYLRQQRTTAQLSLRQLADRAGVSNPYLSQVERGLRRPSAEVLQQLARALEISASAVYARAGLLDDQHDQQDRQPDPQGPPDHGDTPGVIAAVLADPALDERQRQVLIDVYSTFVSHPARQEQT